MVSPECKVTPVILHGVVSPDGRLLRNRLLELVTKSGSYLRLIDFVCHSTLGLRVIKKKKRGV